MKPGQGTHEQSKHDQGGHSIWTDLYAILALCDQPDRMKLLSTFKEYETT